MIIQLPYARRDLALKKEECTETIATKLPDSTRGRNVELVRLRYFLPVVAIATPETRDVSLQQPPNSPSRGLVSLLA